MKKFSHWSIDEILDMPPLDLNIFIGMMNKDIEETQEK